MGGEWSGVACSFRGSYAAAPKKEIAPRGDLRPKNFGKKFAFPCKGLYITARPQTVKGFTQIHFGVEELYSGRYASNRSRTGP